MAFVWTIYGGGAAITTIASPRGGPRSLVLPVVLIAIVITAADRESTWSLRPSSGD